MSKFTEKIKREETISSLVFIILGIMLFLYPGISVVDMAVRTMCRIIAVGLAVYGIVLIVSFLRDMSSKVYTVVSFIVGVVAFVFGLWSVFTPNTILSMVNFVIAAILFIHGVMSVYNAVTLHKQMYFFWWLALILGAAKLVFGILTFLKPFAATAAVARLTGIFLVYDGVTDIWIRAHIA